MEEYSDGSDMREEAARTHLSRILDPESSRIICDAVFNKKGGDEAYAQDLVILYGSGIYREAVLARRREMEFLRLTIVEATIKSRLY